MKRVLDLLLPRVCVGCGVAVEAGEPPLCPLCRCRLPAMPLPLCPRCGATDTSMRRGRGDGRCLECEPWPAALARAAAPFRMEGVAVRVVHGLKYRGWTALTPLMGRAMVRSARRVAGGRPVRLVPVPLAPARRRERGFNQARLIAEGLGSAAGWPVVPLLRRSATGKRQVGLGRLERLGNVGGRFAPLPGLEAGGDAALLVDDVVTTGATASACALALGHAGVPCAGIVSFARSLGGLDEAG